MSYNIFRNFGYLLEPVLSDLVETEKHANGFVAYCIKVEEKGIYWDYDKTTGQEWDKADSSPLKSEYILILYVIQIYHYSLKYCHWKQIKVHCFPQGLKEL